MSKEQIEQMPKNVPLDTIAFNFKDLGLDIKAISEIISKEMPKKEAKRIETLVLEIAKPGQSYTSRFNMVDGRSVDFTINF